MITHPIKIFCIGGLAIALVAFTPLLHNLTGTWVSIGPNHSKVLLEFKPDGNFKVTVDSALENQGRFTFKNDTFRMYDQNCGTTVEGKYKIDFYTPDSAGFRLINDPCKDRSGEIDGGRIKRVK